MQNLYEETKNIMRKYNIKADKSLGQNFLIDENVVNGIVEGAKVSKDDLIIEIGPGLGTLTSILLEMAGKVICVELDKRMIEILEERFKKYNNFKIINDDILKIDINEIIKQELEDKKNVKIVANLPYYITTPIIMKLLESKLNIDTITVMVQKEVAQRLTANTGTRLSGAITYAVEYYSKSKTILEVPSYSFLPEPKVDSEVIQLEIRKSGEYKVDNEKMLFKLIKMAFMQRRKTLINALSNKEIFKSKEEIVKLLEKLNIDTKIRGEDLKLEEFIKIANNIKKL